MANEGWADLVIRFNCTFCGQKIRVPQSSAGKKGKCLKCGNIIVIPKVEDIRPVADKSNFIDSKVSKKYEGLDPAVFDIPQEDATACQLSNQDGVAGKSLEESQKPVEKSAIEEIEPVGNRKLPWVIDIFLYPASASGLANLAIFIGVPLLIDILWRILPEVLGILFGLITLVIKVVVVLYMYWYFAECVRDSADGGLRAPNVRGDFPGVVDMFLQMVSIVGCFLLFFIPFILYVLFVRKDDVIFWLLLIYGVFFFPMALLAIVVLDSFSGLNPRLLISSISKAFFQYCGLVLLFIVAVVLISRVPKEVQQSLFGGLILDFAIIYIVLIGAHLLGRFYWRYQEKLNWEV